MIKHTIQLISTLFLASFLMLSPAYAAPEAKTGPDKIEQTVPNLQDLSDAQAQITADRNALLVQEHILKQKKEALDKRQAYINEREKKIQLMVALISLLFIIMLAMIPISYAYWRKNLASYATYKPNKSANGTAEEDSSEALAHKLMKKNTKPKQIKIQEAIDLLKEYKVPSRKIASLTPEKKHELGNKLIKKKESAQFLLNEKGAPIDAKTLARAVLSSINAEYHRDEMLWDKALSEYERAQPLYQALFTENYLKQLNIDEDILSHNITHTQLNISHLYYTWQQHLPEFETEQKFKLLNQSAQIYRDILTNQPNYIENQIDVAYNLAALLGEKADNLLKSAQKTKAKALWVEMGQYYDAVLKHDPTVYPAMYNWAKIISDEAYLAFTQNNDTEARELWAKAKEKFQHVLTLQPDMAHAYYQLGNISDDEALMALRQNDFKSAEMAWSKACAYYENALKIDPKMHDAAHNWGLTLSEAAHISAKNKSYALAKQLWQKAATKYQLALDINPKMSLAAFSWAQSLEDQALSMLTENSLSQTSEIWEEAAKKYQITLNLEPDLYDAAYALGKMLNRSAIFMMKNNEIETALKLWQDAFEQFLTVLEINPDDAYAVNAAIKILYNESLAIKKHHPESIVNNYKTARGILNQYFKQENSDESKVVQAQDILKAFKALAEEIA